jgi:hypothetical protein
MPQSANYLKFDLGYAARGINYTEKSFMKLTTGANFIKVLTAIINATFSKLP